MSQRDQRRRLWRLRAANLLGVLLSLQAAACGGPTTPACGMGGEPAHPEIGGVFIYTCYAPMTKGDLFLLDLSTGHVRQLTYGAWNIDVSWSPDGGSIAYTSSRDGRIDVYVMDLATGGVRRLTHGLGFNFFPSWSPDGKWIAFESTRDGVSAALDPGYYPDLYAELYVMRSDGTAMHRVTDFHTVISAPEWSPAGDRIVFSSDTAHVFDVYTVAPDGTDLRRITDHGHAAGYAWVPRWSSDASRITFYAAFSSNGPGSIYWVSADGGQLYRVTRNPASGWDAFPDWSPDGQWIGFTRRAADQQLFAVRPDGSNVTQLTNDPGDKVMARWQP